LPNKQFAKYKTSRLHLQQPTLFDWMKHLFFGKIPLLILLVFGVQNISFGQCTDPDLTNPQANCLPGYQLSLDGNGLGTVFSGDINNNSTDNCGIASLIVSPNNFNCTDVGTTTAVTLTVTDAAGNSNSCMSNIMVVDNVAPMITCPAMATVNCPDPTTPANTGIATATDNCTLATAPAAGPNALPAGFVGPENMFYYYMDATSPSANAGECDVITRTWRVYDNQENFVECTQTITLTDPSAPVLDFDAGLAGNQTAAFLSETIECDDAIPAAATPTATDDCDATPTITMVETDTQSGDPTACSDYNYTITRTYTVTDDCGNESTDAYTITVEDTEAPDFSGEITSLNVSSGGACSAFVTVDLTGIPDNCASANLTTTYEVVTMGGSVVNTGNGLDASGTYDVGMYDFNFTATDPCGNVSNHTVAVNINDNVAPTAICIATIQVSVPPTGTATISTNLINDGSNDNCTAMTDLDLTVAPNSVNCGDIGSTVPVTLTVMDANGNTATCMTNVDVVDNSPPAAFCQTVSINLTGNMATVNATDIDDGSNDACATPLTFMISKDAGVTYAASVNFDCTEVGNNTVLLQVEDSNSNQATCSATVTINDTTDPVADCTDITVTLDGNGNYTLTPANIATIAAGSSDNCTFTSAVSPSTFDCDDTGANTVTLTVTDAGGLTDTDNCTITVQDTSNPTATCANFTALVDEDCEVTVNAASLDNGSTDNCSPLTFRFTPSLQTTETFTTTGTFNRTIEVRDPSGNSATCSADIIVVDDKAPTAICISGLTIGLDGNGQATISELNINGGSSDNCSGVTFAISQSTFDCTNIQTNPNIVTLTVTDGFGNSSTCTTPITIQDNTGPALACPADMTISCGTSISTSVTGMATATDNCNGTVAPTFSDATVFNTNMINGVVVSSMDCRTITRTFAAQDNASPANSSSCMQIITVEDTVNPVWSASNQATITTECAPGTNAPIATDDCNGTSELIYVSTVTSNTQNADPTTCGHYDYVIVTDWMAFDSCGNSAGTFTQTQDVNDTQAPVFSYTNNALIFGNNGGTCAGTASLDLTTFVADACVANANLITSFSVANDATSAIVNSGTGLDASGTYSAGSYTATFSAADRCNAATTLMVTFTIVDTETPNPACQPGGATLSLNSSGFAPVTVAQVDNGSSDNCGIASLTINPSTFDCSHAGTTQAVTLTVTDNSGQTNTCSTTFNIVENSPPTIVCPTDITINCEDDLDPAINTNLGMPTVSTICSNTIQPTFQDQTIAGGSNPDCRTIERTWTATNSSGSATCIQIIVVEDNIDPVLSTAPADVTVDCSMIPSPAVLTATDNCAMPPAINYNEISTQNIDPTTCGHYNYVLTRNWEAVDNCGNTDDDNQIITVEDNNAPAFTFPMPLIIGNDPDECFANVNINLGDYITDCADFQYLNVTNNAQTLYGNGNGTDNINGQYAVGDYPIMVTATDPCGNTDMVTFTLSIRDTETPNAVCDTDDILVLDNNGNGTITAADIDEGSSDNCGNVTLSLSQTMFTAADVGTVNLVLTVTDDAGNTSACNTQLTIIDRPRVTVGNISGAMGSTVNVPVLVENFEDICAIQATFTIDDAAVASVTGVSNFNLDGLAATDFNISGNTITLDWIDPDASGENLDGVSIFTIDVELIGNNGDVSTISIDTNPSDFIIGRCFNGGIVGLASTGVDGSVTVTANPMAFAISGRIADPANANIGLANIAMTGSAANSQVTDGTGLYSFPIDAGNTVTITPTKDINPSNGVDVIDVLFIKAHDLNQVPLTDPYKLIAADVNNDNDVNVLDRFLVHAMNINMLAAFPDSESWKFIDAAYTFSADPLNDAYPESATFTNVAANQTNIDFIGVKMGDVSGSANPLLSVGSNGGTIFNNVDDRAGDLLFQLENKELQAGTTIEVPFKAQDFINQMAYQFTLEFDPAILNFQSVTPGVLPELTAEHFGTNDLAAGLLPAQWYHLDATTIEDNEVLFTVTFEVLADAANLSDLLAIVDNPTPAAAFDDALTPSGIDLTFDNSTSTTIATETPVLLNNQPNPFRDETQISFSLPQAGQAILTISDVSGKTLKIVEGYYNTGLQTIILKGNDFPSAGIYFYKLDTEWGALTQKMVVKK
jgi:hypothetical protein